MQFGEHKNGVFHPKRGAGVKEMHPAVGADPRVCPKKRTGHSLAIGAEEDGRSQAEVRRGAFTGRSRVCQNKNNGRKVAACGPLLLGGGDRGGREK